MLFEPEFRRDWPDDKRLVQPAELEAHARELAETPTLFLDYETEGGLPFVLGTFTPERGARVMDWRLVGHEQANRVVRELEKRKGVTAAFNIAYEAKVCRKMGFKLGGRWADPMKMAFATNELRPAHKDHGPFTQKALTYHELGKEPVFAAAVHQWLLNNYGGFDRGWDKIPASLMTLYSIEDITCGYELYEKLNKQVISYGQEELVYHDARCSDVVERAHERGMAFDVERATALSNEYSALYKARLERVFASLGRQFDVHSNQKLFGLLYGEWRLPMHADIEKQGKVDDDVLSWLLTTNEVMHDARKADVISGVQELREYHKMNDTYLRPWIYEWQKDGIIYPNMFMEGARTRRFSANSPNLQNVPARTDLGAALRSAFIARPGYTMYSMDESQAEYRAFADYSGNRKLIEGYKANRGMDIHQMVADMLGIPRKPAKNTNFGVLYGMGQDKMARSLGLTKDKARQHLERYYQMVTGIKEYRAKLSAQVAMHGYVKDRFGGRRHLTSKDAHKALNSTCQMTVADLLRRAMSIADPIITDAGGCILLQVHDELLFELPGTNTEEHLPTLRRVKAEAMESTQHLFETPFVSDCEAWDPNWQHAKTVHLEAA